MGLWLQVGAEVFAKVGPLAALLRVEEDKALGLLLRLWRYGVDNAPPDAPPTGLLDVTDGPLLIAGACRWTADPADLLRALKATGFVEVTTELIRIRGMGRYAATWKKNRIPTGTRTGTGGKPNGNRPGPSRKPLGGRTETDRPPSGFPPQEEEEEEEKEQEKDLTGGGGDLERGKTSSPSPPEIIQQGLAWFQTVQRGRVDAELAAEDLPADYADWWADVFERYGQRRVDEAHSVFIRDPHWRGRGLPFAAFMKQVGDFVSKSAMRRYG